MLYEGRSISSKNFMTALNSYNSFSFKIYLNKNNHAIHLYCSFKQSPLYRFSTVINIISTSPVHTCIFFLSVKFEQINTQLDAVNSTEDGSNSGLLYKLLNNLAASLKQFSLKKNIRIITYTPENKIPNTH